MIQTGTMQNNFSCHVSVAVFRFDWNEGYCLVLTGFVRARVYEFESGPKIRKAEKTSHAFFFRRQVGTSCHAE
jgi:hypothetical protein